MILKNPLSTFLTLRNLATPLTYAAPFWLISLCIFFVSSSLSAQTWTHAQTIGTHRQSLAALASTPEGLLIGLTFSESFTLQETSSIHSLGEEDLLLLRRTDSGQLELVLHGGSSRADAIDVLAVDGAGHLLLAGSFWSSIDFGTFQLTSDSPGQRALFLLKIDTSGQLIWAHIFNGPGIKQITDLVVDEQHNIFLGGYFAQELQLIDTSLTSTAASSAFYLRLRENGERDWCHSFGETGNTRATVVEQYASRQYLLGGYYDDSLKIANQLFPANTNDEDAFLLAVDTRGQIDWVRKAGGVFPELPAGLATDEQGNSYLTGQIVGVMVINDSLRIESRDGNADCFLIRYDSLGRANWAQVLGGDQLQQANDLLYQDGQLWLTGHYQENLKLGELQLAAAAPLTFEGFLAVVDTSGQPRELVALSARPGPLLANHLSSTPQGVWVGGDFSGELQVGDFLLSSPIGGFASYLAAYSQLPTNTQLPALPAGYRLFPNPTSGVLHLQSPAPVTGYSVWNRLGQCLGIYQGDLTRPLPVGNWPAGLYYLQVQHVGSRRILPFVIR